jgi:hypothetical protein
MREQGSLVMFVFHCLFVFRWGSWAPRVIPGITHSDLWRPRVEITHSLVELSVKGSPHSLSGFTVMSEFYMH